MAQRGTLAELVKARRTREGLSQDALARRIGVSRGTISQIESGETLRPTTAVLVGLSRVLRLSTDELMTAAGITPPRPAPEGPLATWDQIKNAIDDDRDITPEERRGLEFALGRLVKPVLEEAAAKKRREKRAG